MQGQYNLTYREEEREMNKYCAFAGIGLIPWGPLAAGSLARPHAERDTTTRSEISKKLPWYVPPAAYEDEIIRRVEKVANDKGWKMSQVALAWINEKVTSPIVGFSSVSGGHQRYGSGPEWLTGVLQVARLEEAIIPGYKLTEEETKYLEEPCVELTFDHVIVLISSLAISRPPLKGTSKKATRRLTHYLLNRACSYPENSLPARVLVVVKRKLIVSGSSELFYCQCICVEPSRRSA
jgi:hypothetical protein